MRLRSPALLCSLALLSAIVASAAERKPRIAVFSGPTATIQNSRPLVTSNKARAAAGLPPLTGADGRPLTDELFMQRIAAPVTVYVEQFTAHPLEGEVAALYAAPDGFVAADGSFSPTRRSPADKPVYAVTLRPEDGLYPLPFMGRQAAGSAWDGVGTTRGAPFEQSRQTFYPDGSRIFEEIERLGGRIHEKAEFTFFRPAPSGGFTSKGEKRGEDFYGYGPYNASPSRPALARATNIVAAAARDTAAAFDGFIWLEGSPSIEDTIYWLGLVIDTTKPFIGNSAQRARGLLSADGDANIVDSVNYIIGRVWDDGSGRDRVG
ncbi:MAG: hypothetical protein NTV51_19050, partial [Verrucomicrobia bacterium]|nr:hypothetical protein [Verrucomicrobiota bacterium]